MGIESFYKEARAWEPMWVCYALVECKWDGVGGSPMFSNQQDAHAWGKLNYPNKRWELEAHQFRILNGHFRHDNPVPWIDGNLNLLLDD